MSKKQLKENVAAGDKFAEKRDWDSALEAYEKALETDPFDKVIHERIIKCYIAKHDRHGYLEAVNRWKQLKESPQPKKGRGAEKSKPEQPPIVNAIDIEEEEEPPEKPQAKPFVTFEPPQIVEPPKPPPAADEHPPREQAKPQLPAEFLRKEPPKPPASSLREIPFPLKPEPKPVKSEPTKFHPEPDAKPAPKPLEPVPGESSREKAPPEEPRTPVTEADMAEADARQLERQGKKDAASKSYVQAAKLWEDKGDKDKAGIAYEKAYEMAPSMEILTRLNELYGQGVKLKQSTVMEIYRRIYHMKV